MQDVNTLFFNNSTCGDEAISESGIDMQIRGIENFARLTNTTAFVIDFDRHKMLYRTDRMLFLDQVSYNDYQRESENPYWGLVTEDTLNYLLLLRKSYPLLSQAMDAEDYRTHICTIDFPIIVKKHEFFINQKFTPLVMRSDGITKIGLFLINPSTSNHLESFIITQSEIRWRFDIEEEQYMPFNLRTSLSFMEKVILERIKKGMTNEEIATNLNLSVPTIKTHRMRIFKKLSVKTMAEALTVIGNYNLI